MKKTKHLLCCHLVLMLILFACVAMPVTASETPYDNQGVHGYVVRLYETVLGRQPDEIGLNEWYQLLVSGSQTGAQVARDFFMSPEYLEKNTSNDTYLRDLYRALFDRDADGIGYEEWMAQLDAGVPRINILKGFVDSIEFSELCNRFSIEKGTVEGEYYGPELTGTEKFILRLYKTALGRDADEEGMTSWNYILANKIQSGADVAFGFIFSPECIKMNLSNQAFVELLYSALFDRGADSEGLATWMHELERGMSREYVFSGFVNSIEFGELCAAYNIDKGDFYVRCIDPDKPMVALTFDDGPSAHTPRVLDALEQYHQVATFFVVGTCASVYPEYITRAYEMGCEIGNHTYNHPDLTRVSYAEIQNQINKTNALIYKATGTYATVTRTPGGSVNNTVKNAINNPIILWSIDTVDWKTRNTQATVNCVLNNVEDGDIVLMHDLHKPTAAAAEIIVPALVERGYQLVTVSELAQYRGNGLENHKVYYGFTN